MKKLLVVLIAVCLVSVSNAQVQFYVNAQNDMSEVATSGSTTIDVVCNDSYLDFSDVTLSTSNGTSGSVINNNDGTITYTNSGNYNDDTLSYTLTNGDSNSTAMVYIVMTSVVPNVAPVVVNDNASDTGYVAMTINVVSNDTDSNGDSLTITNVSNGNNGSTSIVNNRVVYTPNANWVGLDTLTYSISDGNGGTDNGTIYVQSGTSAQITSYGILMPYFGTLMNMWGTSSNKMTMNSDGTFDQVGAGPSFQGNGTWYLLSNGNVHFTSQTLFESNQSVSTYSNSGYFGYTIGSNMNYFEL